jgi:hypothetical protein
MIVTAVVPQNCRPRQYAGRVSVHDDLMISMPFIGAWNRRAVVASRIGPSIPFSLAEAATARYLCGLLTHGHQ